MQASVFAVGISFAVITVVMMGLRMFVELYSRKTKPWRRVEEGLMLIGSSLTIGFSVASMISAWYGMGTHMLNVDTANFNSMLQANFATRLLYALGNCLVKASVLERYRQINIKQWYRCTVVLLMAVTAAFSIAAFLLLLFSCTPPSLFWDLEGQAEHAGKCFTMKTQQTLFNVIGIFNITLDVVLFVPLPIFIICPLQMPLYKKIGAGSLLGIGFISVAGLVDQFLSDTTSMLT
ncbi:hypothetical protein HBI23_246850 [Parastagonospora nodorum]|nr:hypothetical protein HBI23_246850 [Parastagonospora nodorum]KAH5622334.1 hypothetical protein HBI51_246910 [Parastagonospora nodorum]KAH5982824.1 hypothetical protein HBI84_250220 [Parastagonospora nodorum]KAH6380583.1 hypothetical protein HBI08_235130 [Parastagonospora nodorum]KAH6383988.1 hypothetical protein HBI60_251670 [Parastagonospora nodorum]